MTPKLLKKLHSWPKFLHKPERGAELSLLAEITIMPRKVSPLVGKGGLVIQALEVQLVLNLFLKEHIAILEPQLYHLNRKLDVITVMG